MITYRNIRVNQILLDVFVNLISCENATILYEFHMNSENWIFRKKEAPLLNLTVTG